MAGPWVYREAGSYRMLITARSGTGPSFARGLIGQACSDDMLRWRVEPPLTIPSDFAEMEVPQLLDVNGRRVLIFSCGMAALAPHRRAEPGAGGSYYLVLDDDPTPSATAVPLRVPGLYACRVVRDRAGEPHVIGFVDRDEHGRFGGTLSDPIPFEVAAPAVF